MFQSYFRLYQQEKLHLKNFKWPSNPSFAAASRHGRSQTAGTIAAVIFNWNQNFLFCFLRETYLFYVNYGKFKIRKFRRKIMVAKKK